MSSFRKWQLDSAGQQQTFYEQFGDRKWDSIERTDSHTLNTKIAFVLHGKPLENCASEEALSVRKTKSKLLELTGSGPVNFGCVFICILIEKSKESFVYPLIRVKKAYGDDIFFVERQPGRVYQSWRDFLENNKLAKCHMCFPTNGFYVANNGRVMVTFRESPSYKTVKILDVVSAVGKITSTSLLAVSTFFPIVTPVLVTAGAILGGSTVYSASRGISQLIDRDKHHQSISLVDGHARSLWIDISNDIIGSVLVGGAAVLPRFIANGRLAASAVTTALEMLSWASIGVNSFGIVANITSLIIKCKEGTLQKCDMEFFLTACLFIGNMILDTVIAEKVISELSNQPGQIYRFFKMTANTGYKAVKSIIRYCSFEFAFNLMCGRPAETVFRFFDMQYTLSIVTATLSIVMKFKEKEIDMQCLSFELYKLFVNHLNHVRTEIKEAAEKIRKFCRQLANRQLSVNGRKLFCDSQLLAPTVFQSVTEVVDNLSLSDEAEKENSYCKLIKLAAEFGKKVNTDNEKQFADLCIILMNDIKSRCDRRIILEKSLMKNTRSSNEEERSVLDDAVEEIRNELVSQSSLTKEMVELMRQPSDEPCLRPLYRMLDVDVYAFETSAQHVPFNNFINGAVCKLLRVENFPASARIHTDGEHLIMLEFEGRTVLFYYEFLVKTETAFGIVLVWDENSSINFTCNRDTR